MASSGVNVLRWSALVFGVFYGFSHQSAIYSSDRKAHEQHEWDRKVNLIEEAKKKYAQKGQAQSGGDDIVRDPEDPNFDLEKYLNKVSEENS